MDNSIGIVTAICPYVGYETASLVAKALSSNISVKEIIIRDHLLTEEELERVLDPYTMTEPGISGKRV